MGLRALLTALLLFTACAGCTWSEAPASPRDRGPPRILDDGSRPIPDENCATVGEEIGWNASFYNVGGPGRVYLALLANGEMKAVEVVHVEGDAQASATLAWVPDEFEEYETELRWGLSGNLHEMHAGLAGPRTVAYPCGLFCPIQAWGPPLDASTACSAKPGEQASW